MTLKQQNELTLKRIELQMIEDYFSKEARDNRKQHGQMKAILLKYDFEKWLTVVWEDTMTKEFKTVLSNIYTSGTLSNVAFSTVRDKEGQPEFTWKTESFNDYFTVELAHK